MTKPTIIELAAIENSDQKALIIALLLLSILAYVNSNYVGEGDLKNVILLEEAHVLLDADTNAGQGDANPSAIAQGLVKRMLAEIRSYGVGLIIADQSPRKVTTDVVALTDIKVAFRLVEASDKQILAESIDMLPQTRPLMTKAMFPRTRPLMTRVMFLRTKLLMTKAMFPQTKPLTIRVMFLRTKVIMLNLKTLRTILLNIVWIILIIPIFLPIRLILFPTI